MDIAMTEELLFKIDRKIKNEAHIKKENAGYNGEYGDGGAGSMLYSLEMYHKGFYKVIPENWVEYIKEIGHEEDPDYKKYLVLKKKFER